MIKRIVIERFFLMFLFAAGALFVLSCTRNGNYSGELSSFMANTTEGLYSMDRYRFNYDSTNCQIVRNTQRRILRYQKDDQSQMVNAKFSTLLFDYEKEIDIAVNCKNGGNASSFNLKTMLVKMEEGKYWLWDSDKKIGLIVKPYDL